MAPLINPPLRGSSHPVVVVDGHRQVVDANQAACLLVDRPRIDLLGLRLDDLTPPERLEELDARWTRFVREGIATGHWSTSRRDGQLVHFDYFAIGGLARGHHLLVGAHPELDEEQPAGGAPGGTITPRERDVLNRLARGLTGPQIAAELGLSVDTVRTNIRVVKARLGAKTLPHLVAIALRERLLD